MPQIFGALQQSGLMDTLSIIRTTAADDGAGGVGAPVETATNATPLPCSVVPASAFDEQFTGGRTTGKVEYKITFPAVIGIVAVDVSPRDVLRVAARGLEPERDYEIGGLKRASGVVIEARAFLSDE